VWKSKNNPASGTKNTDEPKPTTAPTISEKSAIRKNTETNIELRLPDSASKIQVKQRMVGLSQDRLSIELGDMHD
jgi:hypothetical protein